MKNTMKAIVQTRYGSPDDLQLQEVGKPRPAENEVLIKVHAASVHPDVWHVVTGFPIALRFMGSGFPRPKKVIPGIDMAGRVEAVGENVMRFQPGDAVFGECHDGMQWVNGGAYAEYVCAPEDVLVHKPDCVSFEQAAAVPSSGIIALWNLDNGKRIKAGDRVLVNGAGGGVGTIAMQIAKAFGAEVTGVDCGRKLDFIRSLGADHVIDYTQENFTQGDQRYDLIFDIPGNNSFSDCKRVLTPEGKYILIAHDDYGKVGRRLFGSMPRFMGLMMRSFFQSHLYEVSTSFPSKLETMEILRGLLEDGKITPVIGKAFPLDDVGEAFRCLIEGQVLGKIVITPGE